MLYILKLVCLLQKNGKKTGMLYILKLVCLLQKYEKNGMLYILKLVCLIQKYGKNGYVVHIKTSMFTTEIRKKRICCTYLN